MLKYASIMEIIKGTDRTAFVGEDFTFKVARSKPGRFLESARTQHDRYGFRGLLNYWNEMNVDQIHSLKWYLFHGVAANRREQRLSEQGVVIPTVSILGGLVNIQHTVPSTGLDFDAVRAAFIEHVGQKVATVGHMLEDMNNFGVLDGQVKFVDGGSEGLERVMETHPERIENALGALSLQLEAGS
jgi:hypothetical protein